jgi:hypothetical protein
VEIRRPKPDPNTILEPTADRIRHDFEITRRAEYEQEHGHPEDLFINPMAFCCNNHAQHNYATSSINNFRAFSSRLLMLRYPKDFKPAIDKYNGRSDPSYWLKMYSIAA